MLQQTQADRVVPYYEAFVRAFPTAVACARAEPGDVVRRWSGLGYNRRALNLHRAAMVIADQHAGVVPSDERALRALPGVGPYTARAVRSFAFELDGAVVDTNVIRVLTRCVEGRGLTVPEAQRLADRLVPPSESWAFNQTMFDLGATVCIGTAPHCGRCPLQRQCRWHQSGWAEPDPWRASPSVRVQSRFAGSDRQGRGRLLDRLRSGTVAPAELAASCGWPDDQSRAQRIAAALVTEGFAVWAKGHDGREALQLR